MLFVLASAVFATKLIAKHSSVSFSAQTTTNQGDLPFDQAQALADLKKRIAGQENKPAAEVFKNVQIPMLKAIPADRFLRVMELGYTRSLGVNCIYCNVAEEWEKEEKTTKQICA
jgi:hypothetical protein